MWHCCVLGSGIAPCYPHACENKALELAAEYLPLLFVDLHTIESVARDLDAQVSLVSKSRAGIAACKQPNLISFMYNCLALS